MRKSRKVKRREYILRRAQRFQKNLHKEASRRRNIRKQRNLKRQYRRRGRKQNIAQIATPKLIAPSDFRLLQKPSECAIFFKRLLSQKDVFVDAAGDRHIYVELKDIQHIDFASTLMLWAVCEELSTRKCFVYGSSPARLECEHYLKESGFYNKKYDSTGKLIYVPSHAQIMEIQSGEVSLSGARIMGFVKLITQVYEYLGVRPTNISKHTGILKEVCGNSVEWGDVRRRSWTIGAKFEEDKVVFVALDLGQGILKSLRRRLKDRISDIGNSDATILSNVFDSYYGSKSGEHNRNQGLPMIKGCNTDHHIRNLSVVSNNVLVDFTNPKYNQTFSTKQNAFIGTLYSWIVDKDCLQPDAINQS